MSEQVPSGPAPETALPAAKRPYGLYVGGVLLGAAACILSFTLHADKQAALQTERTLRNREADLGVRVLTAKVVRNGGSRTITLPGELRPLHQATLYAKVAGYLQELHVDKGDFVRRGQLLARIASPETDQQLHQANADHLLKLQKQRRLAKLVHGGIVSQQEMDEAEAALSGAVAEQARLQSLKGYEVLQAPFDGVVTARYVDPGALLSAATSSTAAAQPILELQQMQTVRIFVYLAQRQAAYVRDGDLAVVKSPDLPGLNLQAKVTRTARAIDPRTRTMLVEVDVDNQDGRLTPGMFVEVTLTVKAAAALEVPTDAVYLRRGVTHVMVVEGGVAHQRKIEAGADDGRYVEVLGGLREGEVVGLHVGDDVNDGVAVRAIDATAETQAPR